MASLPFYSPEIRDALAELIANHEEHERTAAPFHRATATINTSCALSCSDDGDDETAVESSASSSDDVDDDDQALPASSAMAAVRENEDSLVTPLDGGITTPALPPKSQGTRSNRKAKNKKSKGDKLQTMGRVPSTLLSLIALDAGKTKPAVPRRTALEIPNVLLPVNYLRDNPQLKSAPMASALLASWEQLNGSSSSHEPTIIVVLLQSGRFAAAAFSLPADRSTATMTMLAHKTATRYTVRKGQGGSQASNDQAKGKAKSVGAQLRREGERQLREDVRETWREWQRRGFVRRAVRIYASCPRGMRRDYLFGGEDGYKSHLSAALVEKGDTRLRNVPLDAGRPTLEAAVAVVERVHDCRLREMTDEELCERTAARDQVEPGDVGAAPPMIRGLSLRDEEGVDSEKAKGVSVGGMEAKPTTSPEVPATPLTPLHEAVLADNLPRVTELLALLEGSGELTYDSGSYNIDTPGGPGYQTPLHAASSSTAPRAPALIAALLQGGADPCARDAHGRPPYFLAASDRVREAFRRARGTLGEGRCAWDEGARVGPALTDAGVRERRERALDKKRRQRKRQKEKKVREKAVTEEKEAQRRLEEEERRRGEDAKRVRDGLKPKPISASNTCDFCQKVAKGKKRSAMFKSLEYVYCSTECVKRHQRELTAAAAMARLG